MAERRVLPPMPGKDVGQASGDASSQDGSAKGDAPPSKPSLIKTAWMEAIGSSRSDENGSASGDSRRDDEAQSAEPDAAEPDAAEPAATASGSDESDAAGERRTARVPGLRPRSRAESDPESPSQPRRSPFASRHRDARDDARRTPQRPAPASSHRTRKAHLRLVSVDPWSVMKTSFLLSIAFGIVCVVAVAIVWTVLSAAGVWDSVNTMVRDTVGGGGGQPFDVTSYIGTSRVLGFTVLVAVVDVILITAIATLGAFVYNLAATLLGGVEVTLAEDR
ncbi:MAG: DUF3566 domain-containing protein [Marmoricola sp.]